MQLHHTTKMGLGFMGMGMGMGMGTGMVLRKSRIHFETSHILAHRKVCDTARAIGRTGAQESAIGREAYIQDYIHGGDGDEGW